MKLKSVELFKSMDSALLNSIIEHMRLASYKSYETVLREHDAGQAFYLIEEGYFDCFTGQATHSEKIYGPGEYFGLESLLYSTPEKTTVVARTEGKVYVLERKVFSGLVREERMRRMEFV